MAARRIVVETRRELTEGSAAVITPAQVDVVFTINDSGHDAMLFAVDTGGRDRGAWRVENATNVDWEAAAHGPCGPRPVALDSSRVVPESCLYIADVGDNDEHRNDLLLYRVPEPIALAPGATGVLVAQRLRLRYEDGPHDVEAMVVGPAGDTYFFTKRARRDGARLRPSLVFHVPASAWEIDSLIPARLVDSLPIVPGSTDGRLVTDAARSLDGRYVAVRTYDDVYIFSADSASGRPGVRRPHTQCRVGGLERGYGEGIAWFGRSGELLLTHEGRRAPMYVIRCPLPAAP
ncbi:MAG: hypothetical protein IT361_14610 [Gemmatimonadaceae bacterium]|nr:hypothetical protein [Gemmatimonadaceae bacterium]